MSCVSRAFALPLASLAFGSCATDAPVAATPRADAALLSVTGSIGADAPKLRIREQLVPYAEHRLVLHEARPARVTLTSQDEGFDTILECRPVDGRPEETLRNDDATGLGTGSRIDLLPTRDGEWTLLVGDAQGRLGSYRLEVARIFERVVFRSNGVANGSATGTEPRATFFCPIVAGRRYRVDVEADGFPPHLAVGAPGMGETTSNEGRIEFLAARTGQAIAQVASLSLAHGPFRVTVTELW